MSDDKMFELMTKIYGELTEFREDTNSRFNNIETEVKGLKNDIIRLEDKFDTHSKALYDGYKQAYEIAVETRDAVEKLATKVDKNELEIHVIKGGK